MTNFRKQIMLSSVPFIGIEGDEWNISSCFLIDYKSKRIMITAAHAALDYLEWAIFTKFSFDPFGTYIRNINCSYNPIISDGGEGDLHRVDICVAIVSDDYQPIWQEIDFALRVVKEEEPRTIHCIDFDIEPSTGLEYGFSGFVNSDRYEDHSRYNSDAIVISGMKYIGKEEECLLFEVPEEQRNHENLKGSSGAPIIDSLGNVIAFVKGGREEENLIIGVSLSKYKGFLDLAVLDVPTKDVADWLDDIMSDKIKNPIWNDTIE